MSKTNVDRHLERKLKDPLFRELYELEMQKAQIAKLLIAERTKRNLTQGQLARKLGVTQQQISKIENGNFTDLKVVQKVLLTLGHSIRVVAVPLRSKTKKDLKAA